MKAVAQLLNEMCARGVIQNYALFGVAAQMRYTEPVATLTREALDQAETADFDGVSFRVVQAVHLAVIALRVGRAKNFTRILSLLESGSVTRQEIARLAARHGLSAAWR